MYHVWQYDIPSIRRICHDKNNLLIPGKRFFAGTVKIRIMINITVIDMSGRDE